MKILNYIFFLLLVTFTIYGCSKKEKPENVYNQKANEIILQVLTENNCNCLLEIQNKTLIETSEGENPSYDIRSFLKSELRIVNNQELNNLVNLSKKFALNIEMLEKNNIKIINPNDIPKLGINNVDAKTEIILKMCPNNIINVNKPVFDKTYQKAVVDFGFAFSCTKTYPLPIYQYKNEKRKRIKK